MIHWKWVQEGKLQEVFCCRTSDKTWVLDYKGQRERERVEDLQLAYLLSLARLAYGFLESACWSWGLGQIKGG